jgi:hypothetical protein
MFDGSLRPTALLLLVALTGCDQRALRYDDDVDVAGLEAKFGCGDTSISGDRAHACRMLRDFASAQTFSAWPGKGLETWYGRKICIDSIDAKDRMDLTQVHLHPGVGKPVFPQDVKTDPARDVPHGAQFIATSIGSSTPEMLRGYQRTIEAAEQGGEPKLDDLTPFDRDYVRSSWERSKRPPGTKDFYRLVTSKGTSILGGPLTTDAKDTPAATYYVRGKDKRMLVFYASWGDKPTPCIGEAWRIHIEP